MLVFIIASIIVVIFLYNYFFSKAAIINRKLKKAPYKKIAEFVEGETAKIVGKIVFIDEALSAPLSGRACSYFYVLVEEKVSSGKSSSWKTLIEEVGANRLVITDGTDYALINHQKMKSNIVFDKEFSSGTFNDAHPLLEAFLQKHGEQSEGTFGLNKTLRYKEGVLEKNEVISVLGKGHWQLTESLGLQLPCEKVLVVGPTADDALYLSDDPETTVKTTNKPAPKKRVKTVVSKKAPPRQQERTGRYLK